MIILLSLVRKIQLQLEFYIVLLMIILLLLDTKLNYKLYGPSHVYDFNNRSYKKQYKFYMVSPLCLITKN
jgi:hypothetical protein